MVDWERRSWQRLGLDRQCKVYVPRAGRYLAGSTWNVSGGGVLLQVPRGAPIAPGDRVFVGVAQTRRRAILSANEMLAAEVLRVMPAAGDRVAVAVRFVEPAATGAPLRSAA